MCQVNYYLNKPVVDEEKPDPLPADIREAVIQATVEALLLDLEQFPDLPVDGPNDPKADDAG